MLEGKGMLGLGAGVGGRATGSRSAVTRHRAAVLLAWCRRVSCPSSKPLSGIAGQYKYGAGG